MDFISYRGLPLDVIESVEWGREPQLDESQTTYRDVKWSGSLVCTYNPGAIAYQSGNPPTRVGAAGHPALPTQLPAQTDAAIREYLSQPRGQLIVRSLSNTVLVSPSNVNGVPGPCDTRGGPFVHVNSIQRIDGERCWKIHLTFETYTNETPSPFVIVSNRWSMTHAVNWQNVTQRIIRGICHVRGDLLRNSAYVAAPNTGLVDSLRNAFCAFGVPQNFQRERVDVAVTPDGNSVHYVVTDTEQLFNKSGLINFNVPRVEVADTNWMAHGSWGRAVAEMTTNAARNSWWDAAWRSVTSGGVFGAAPGTLRTIAQQLPKRYKSAVCRVWANRNLLRTAATKLAIQIAAGRLGRTAFFDTTTSEIIVNNDTNNHCTVQWTVAWDYQTALAGIPLGVTPINIGPNAGNGDSTWATSITQSTDITQGVGGVVLLTQNDGNNPAFSDGGTRGTYLQNAVVQTLESFNTAPAPPP